MGQWFWASKGRKAVLRRWTSSCLGNKGLLAPAETMGHDFPSTASCELEASRRWLPSWYRSSICVYLGSLRGRSKVLPESLSYCLQLQIICRPKRYFGVASFSSLHILVIYLYFFPEGLSVHLFVACLGVCWFFLSCGYESPVSNTEDFPSSCFSAF